jgi:hypothetical protein
MSLPLTTRGRVVDVRPAPDRRKVDEKTGEITYEQSDQRIVVLLFPGKGSDEYTIGAKVDDPIVGQFFECDVTVRAYSGFVRNGHAGDARVQQTITAFRWIDDPTVLVNDEAKAALHAKAEAGRKAAQRPVVDEPAAA